MHGSPITRPGAQLSARKGSRQAPRPASTSAAAIVLCLACCAKSDGPGSPSRANGAGAASSDQGGSGQNAPKEGGTPVQGYEVVQAYPHDPNAYTQGLLMMDGVLYESTGQWGESTVRIVDLEKGEPSTVRSIPASLFGEGLAALDEVLYLITWKAHRALVYDRETLRPRDYEYSYMGEGWGLTTSPEGFVMSNGSSELQFINPKGFKPLRTIEVTDRGRPVIDLNELEWINGEIWANVWKTDRVARIDPATGNVNAWIDFEGLLPSHSARLSEENVLNGIAYDEASGNVYVTGKRWPKLFHVRILE